MIVLLLTLTHAMDFQSQISHTFDEVYPKVPLNSEVLTHLSVSGFELGLAILGTERLSNPRAMDEAEVYAARRRARRLSGDRERQFKLVGRMREGADPVFNAQRARVKVYKKLFYSTLIWDSFLRGILTMSLRDPGFAPVAQPFVKAIQTNTSVPEEQGPTLWDLREEGE